MFFRLGNLCSGDLPLDAGGGCTLYVSIDVPNGTALNAQGAAQIPLSIPNNQLFVGITFHYQWLVLDSASKSPFGFAHSNAASANL